MLRLSPRKCRISRPFRDPRNCPGLRFLLQDPDPQTKIRTLLAAREPFYRQADVLVNTEMRSVREVAQQVTHQFRLAQSAGK